MYYLLKLTFKSNLTSNVLYYDGKSFMFERLLSLPDEDSSIRYIFFVTFFNGVIYIHYKEAESNYIVSMTELERLRASMLTVWV